MGGILFVLAECLFSGDHRDGVYVVQFQSGVIFAGCHHQNCGRGIQRWTDLKEVFDDPGKKLDYEAWRKEQNRKRALAKMSGDIPEPDKSSEVSGEEKSRREDIQADEKIISLWPQYKKRNGKTNRTRTGS